MNHWFSSDWHYGHKNIVRGCSDWSNKDTCRNFDTLKEHNDKLVENINRFVKKDDFLHFLGDFAFGGKDNIEEFRKRINCENIFLIYGNHDIHIRKNYNNCHNLFKSCKDIEYRKIGKDSFVLCHYAMRTWENAHHGSIMLYGHSHGTLPEYETVQEATVANEQKLVLPFKFRTMDVGIDTHPEFRPYHIDEIRHIMSTRISLLVDHHNEKTN